MSESTASRSSADLQTEFLGNTFENPLIVASGTLVERYEQIQPFIDAGAGAVIPRTTRLVMERTVHPSPHLYHEGARARANMMNAEWTGSDISYWRQYLGRIAESSKIAMAVSGRDIEGCIAVCKELDQHDIPFIEVNVGCGVTNGVISAITRDEEHVRRLVGSIKQAGVETPIALKLGHSDSIVPLCQIAKDEGADGIVAINTLGPVFDFTIGSDGKPRSVLGVSGAKGGLSGSDIFRTALTDVATIKREVQIPVAASGGVTSAERAVKMIMAGADVVEVYTLLHDSGQQAPNAMSKLLDSFEDYLSLHGISSVEGIKSAALHLMDQPTELKPQIPIVAEELCTGCDRCVPVCLPDVIKPSHEAANRNGHVVNIHQDGCVGCGSCISVCPVEGAIRFPEQTN